MSECTWWINGQIAIVRSRPSIVASRRRTGRAGTGLELHGSKPFVFSAGAANYFLVTARDAATDSIGVFRIAADARQLRITVRDDGRGAPPEAFEAATAYGVMGMRERARHFGGVIEIESQIGLGAAFHLRMPLQNE